MKGAASPQLPFCKSYKHILENTLRLRRIYAFRQLWLPKREGTHVSGEDCRKAYILRNFFRLAFVESVN